MIIFLEQYLTGLRFKYNSINCEDFLKLAPVMERFVNVVSLDLSCNSISVCQSDVTCVRLGELLSKLPLLVRLDLSNNRIRTKLRQVLSGIQKSLQYIRLVACGLTLTDIAYLSVSHHVSGLTELDISENSLQPACCNVGKMVQASKSNLSTLELEDCGLRSDYLLELDVYFKNLESMLYINLAENLFSIFSLESFCRTIARSPNLKVIRFSYPLECYVTLHDHLEEERIKKECVEHLKNILKSERRIMNVNTYPKLIVVELERRIE